jgi:hypothetical protein
VRRGGCCEVRLLPQTQLQANCDTGDAIATPSQTPAAEKDPVLAEMEAIGKAESWKHGKGGDHVML